MTEIEKLYRQYFKDVYLYSRRLCGDEKLAEDITSETFFKALKGLDSFRGTCDVRVWLCQIAKNCYLSHLRKEKKIEVLEEVHKQPDKINVEQLVGDAVLCVKVHEVLHRMDEPYKEVFTLRIFGELGFKQIGKLFGKTENWACVTYYRARKKIMEQMEGHL